MRRPDKSQGEYPNTYFVQDRSNNDEMARLHVQDSMLTSGMGGTLPEQTQRTRLQSILDVGCGTGGWLIEIAETFEGQGPLVGVDVSERVLAYARGQAEAHHVADRVEFRLMDVLQRLDFPDNAFDLVNERLGGSYLRTWDWPHLLAEFRRITKPGGVVRLTEGEIIVESSSTALLQLNRLLVQALHQAGHFFEPVGHSITGQLPRLLRQHGFQQVQVRPHTLECRAGTTLATSLFDDARHLFQTVRPFLQKWIQLPEDYDAIYQRMLEEMQQDDFVAIWRLLTAWGNVSLRKGQ